MRNECGDEVTQEWRWTRCTRTGERGGKNGDKGVAGRQRPEMVGRIGWGWGSGKRGAPAMVGIGKQKEVI